jgi:hypothetical protein
MYAELSEEATRPEGCGSSETDPRVKPERERYYKEKGTV